MMRQLLMVVQNICMGIGILLLFCALFLAFICVLLWWLVGGQVKFTTDTPYGTRVYMYRYFTVVDSYLEVPDVQE